MVLAALVAADRQHMMPADQQASCGRTHREVLVKIWAMYIFWMQALS